MRIAVVLCASVLAASAGLTLAQEQPDGVEPLAPIEEVRHVYPVGFPPVYSSRAVGTVYNNGGEAGTNTSGTTLGNPSWGDEQDFSVGPWSTAATRLATELIVWVQSSGAACPTTPVVETQPYDILVDFWADADHDYTLNPMTTGTPLASLRVSVVGTCGVQTGWIVNLTGLPGGGLLIPTSQVFICSVQKPLIDRGSPTP